MGFAICYWVLPLLSAAWTKAFTVQGPAVPLSVQLGASVTLPCSVDTPLPLNELEVQWMRAESGTLVHLFQDGQSRPESQNPSYSSRAEFFTEEIPKGNFSLLFINVTTEDIGLYKCIVHTDQRSNETNVEIKVERLVVTGASEPVSAYAGEDVILNCSVDTHAPLQELEVQWEKTDQQIMVLLFQEGQNIPESQHERFRDRAEFFTEEIPKGNFSLKLRGVRTEDKGEYMCKVHTDTDSVNATAWLKELGFSSLHISVLVLAIAAPVVAVALSIPAFRSIIREDESNGSLKLCCLQVVVPCIMICVAFIMWGVIEGFIAEAYTCSAVNLMRILMLFKVAPYLGLFPEKFCNICKNWAVCEYGVVLTGVNSIILWKFLTERAPETSGKVFTIFFGILPVLLIPFIFVKPGTRSLILIWMQVLTSILEMLFLSITFIAVSIEVIAMNLVGSLGLGACSSIKIRHARNTIYIYGYVIKKIFMVGFFILAMSSFFKLLDIISEKNEEHAAWMCLIAFMFILTVTADFKHRINLPVVPQICVYCFGAAGLPIVNCVALATELIQKAYKGERTVEDLRVIVLPFECIFLTCWIGLQVYAYYMEKNEKIKRVMRFIFRRGQTQSHNPASSQRNQISHDAQEMVPLSQPKHNASNSQGAK